MDWVIKKEIKLGNKKKVKAWVPNPKVSRDKALEKFKELTIKIAKARVKVSS